MSNQSVWRKKKNIICIEISPAICYTEFKSTIGKDGRKKFAEKNFADFSRRKVHEAS